MNDNAISIIFHTIKMGGGFMQINISELIKNLIPFFALVISLLAYNNSCVNTKKVDALKISNNLHEATKLLGQDPYSELITVPTESNNQKIKNNLLDAKKLLHEALLIDPDNSKVQHIMGTYYIAVEKYEKAIKHFQKALDLDRDNYKALFNLAFVYFKKKNLITQKFYIKNLLRKNQNYIQGIIT